MHNATAITTGSANQRPNTPCIRLWIDVTFRGLEDSYWRHITGIYYFIFFLCGIEQDYLLELKSEQGPPPPHKYQIDCS